VWRRAWFATVKRSSEARPWNLGAAAKNPVRFFSLFATVKNPHKVGVHSLSEADHFVVLFATDKHHPKGDVFNTYEAKTHRSTGGIFSTAYYLSTILFIDKYFL
jgi:hypothetical protein